MIFLIFLNVFFNNRFETSIAILIVTFDIERKTRIEYAATLKK